MLKNSKVVIGIGVVLALLGVLLALQEGYTLLGVLLIVVAVAGAGGLLWSNAQEAADFLEAPDEDEPRPPRASASTSTATAEPLATWSAEPLATWSPPEADAEVEAADDTFGDSALDELEALEDVDPVAEVARIEQDVDDREVLEPYEAEFESVELEEVEVVEVVEEDEDLLAPVDEDLTAIEEVESADDIMKASAATELKGPAADENSELAKLLAKVQSRLAAYE